MNKKYVYFIAVSLVLAVLIGMVFSCGEIIDLYATDPLKVDITPLPERTFDRERAFYFMVKNEKAQVLSCNAKSSIDIYIRLDSGIEGSVWEESYFVRRKSISLSDLLFHSNKITFSCTEFFTYNKESKVH